MLVTTAALDPWPVDRRVGVNECTPNPVLKVKTSHNYDIILCNELGIAHCCLVKVLPQFWLAKRRHLISCLWLTPVTHGLGQ